MKRFTVCVLLAALLISGCSSGSGTRESKDYEARHGEVTSESIEETYGSSDTSENTMRSENPEVSVDTTSSATPVSDSGLSDQLLVKDIIGEVNGDRYQSELGGVAYVIEDDASFAGRDSNQVIYGDVDLDSKLKDLPSNKLVAGEAVKWPDGSNLGISYQYVPAVTGNLQDTFLNSTLTQTTAALESLGYTMDTSQISQVEVSGKEYKAVEIKFHNDLSKMHQMMVFIFRDNGIVTYLSATSAGDKYPVDLILKNVELQ